MRKRTLNQEEMRPVVFPAENEPGLDNAVRGEDAETADPPAHPFVHEYSALLARAWGGGMSRKDQRTTLWRR